MKHIVFSHHYPKLHGQTSARLLAVIPRKRNEMSEELIEYDTTYFTDDGHKEYFPLKSGNYIQLVFIGNLGIPFCTIRSAFPQSKVEYYTSAIGEDFAIKFKGDEVRDGN